MTAALRALRGATTVDEDTPEQVSERVQTLMSELFLRNGVDEEDLVSIIFTSTEDVCSTFPATAARAMGLGDVPLLGAREIAVEGALARCIRVLVHLYTERSRSELRHVYLEGARGLRDDLAD